MELRDLIQRLKNADCSETQTSTNSVVYIRDDKGNSRSIERVYRNDGNIYIELEPTD